MKDIALVTQPLCVPSIKYDLSRAPYSFHMPSKCAFKTWGQSAACAVMTSISNPWGDFRGGRIWNFAQTSLLNNFNSTFQISNE